MRQTMFQEKYPMFVAEIGKDETSFASVDEIVAHLRAKVEAHPKAVFIAEFDHYTHTKALGGEIGEGIQAAKNLVFCFGFVLPNATVMGVRPRSFGVCDMGDKFIVSFLEPPMAPATQTMETWVKELRNR